MNKEVYLAEEISNVGVFCFKVAQLVAMRVIVVQFQLIKVGSHFDFGVVDGPGWGLQTQAMLQRLLERNNVKNNWMCGRSYYSL
jgi:hypothetical protein